MMRKQLRTFKALAPEPRLPEAEETRIGNRVQAVALTGRSASAATRCGRQIFASSSAWSAMDDDVVDLGFVQEQQRDRSSR